MDSTFECIVAAGVLKSIESPASNAFEALQVFQEQSRDWIFGHLAYDLKNQTEDLTSANNDEVNFPDLFFFVPQVVIILSDKEIEIGVTTNTSKAIYASIMSSPSTHYPVEQENIKSTTLKSRYTRNEYIQTVQQLKAHILRGECYEINFCQEFYLDDYSSDPIVTFQKLQNISPNPFGALYRLNDRYCICASPERFLKKKATRLFSQPIKGTAPRVRDNGLLDLESRNSLSHPKERSENVMIVDLVRNDLAKVCKEGSVLVDELCGVYSFPQVHQMISTISGKVDNDFPIDKILKATFPMASMTGAPKLNVLKLVEKYERTRRGLFSGSIGYITPGNDFDFNVVIRSILYNSTVKYLSIQAGSAITFESDPEMEYEECLLKISALQKILA